MSFTSRCLEKHENSIVSKFDEIQRGSWISRDDPNGEIRFVIRDLEKFRVLTEITILPFFRNFEFSRVLHISSIYRYLTDISVDISVVRHMCGWKIFDSKYRRYIRYIDGLLPTIEIILHCYQRSRFHPILKPFQRLV